MKRFALILGFLVFIPAIMGCSEKSSKEACEYETSLNLDKGNYDAVINSGCADAMQKGAAYFGRAGYDIKDVINRFIEAQTVTNKLSFYVSQLIGVVNDSTLTDLNNAKEQYSSIPHGDVNYKDAQFYLSLVQAINALSLLNAIIGEPSTCDINGNSVPDDADAASCALLTSAGQPCTGATATRTPTDINIQGKNGTYRGVTITITGAPTPSCPSEYKRLYYKLNSNYYTAVTTSELCQEASPDTSRQWPCPFEIDGQPVGLVEAIDTSLTDSVNALGESLGGISTDLTTSIQEIRTQACGGDTCTEAEISSYISTLTL